MTEKMGRSGEKAGSAGEASSKLETREERAKRRRFEVIRRNHGMAMTALRVESLLSQIESEPDPYSPLGPQIQKELDSLPEKFGVGFQSAIFYYRQIKHEMGRCEREMEKWAGKEKKFGKIMTPERWGEFMFTDIAGRPPKGKVTFRRREAFFVMTFSELSDYAAVYSKGWESEESLKRAERTGGSYHYSIPLHFFQSGYYGPVLIIRDDQQYGINQVELHERQHFINDKVFKSFYFFETRPSFILPSGMDEEKRKQYLEKEKTRVKLSKIKDEVLAYIRDGSLGLHLESSLLGELYTNLFSPLSPEEAEKAKKVINTVATFLDKNRSFLNDPEIRAILVYQLVSVPLDEFPKWLDVFEEYYGERSKVFDKFFRPKLPLGLSSLQDFSDLIKGVFPSPIEEELKARGAYVKGPDILKHLSLIENGACDVLYNQRISFSKAFSRCKELGAEHAELYAKLKDLYEPLFRGPPICIPCAGHMMGYGSNEKDSWSEKQLQQLAPSTIRVKQAVLDVVSSFTKEDINLIATFLEGRSEKEPEVARLVDIVRRTVYNFNHDRTCHLTFYETYGKNRGSSFRMKIDYLASPRDEERGIERVVFSINFWAI